MADTQRTSKNLLSHAKWLRMAADEIAKAGHNGWGNTCLQAAEAIERECARPDPMGEALNSGDGSYRP